MSQQEHPLIAVQPETVVKEFNLSKIIGQVALGVTVTLTVRYLVSKWDIFTAKRKSN
ncbi:MAG: hypothetical protein H7836_04400 [Magnetococcus sp. YQC-3]